VDSLQGAHVVKRTLRIFGNLDNLHSAWLRL
jgi:hypothetical protein